MNVAGAQVSGLYDGAGDPEYGEKGSLDQMHRRRSVRMKVILLQDVKSLGKKGDTVKVKRRLRPEYDFAEEIGCGGYSRRI